MSDNLHVNLTLTINGTRVIDTDIDSAPVVSDEEHIAAHNAFGARLDSDRRVYNEAIQDVLNLRAQFGLTNSDSINVHEASRRISELRR